MTDVKQKTGAKPSKRVLDKKFKKRQGDGNEPTKEEYAVAKYVRFQCPTKKTTFGHGFSAEDVRYFIGSKAVDCLMESKWSGKSKKASTKTPPLFNDRKSCVDYMQQLLMKGLFFRAKKLVPKLKEKPTSDGGGKKKDQKKTGDGTKEETPKQSPKAGKESGEVKRRKKEKEQKDEEEEKSRAEKEKEDDDEENGKGKEKTSKARKVRLDFHSEQLFIDGASIYVWKYDPTPMKTFLLGLGIVVGAIALCLFPLWPLQLRTGVYYVSLAAMGLFGVFMGLVILRAVIFGIVWIVTAGRHHFWLLPNLTEDCSVLDSFRPWYSYKYMPPGTKSTDDKDKKKKKSKKSDTEDEGVEEVVEGQQDDEKVDQDGESGSDNGGEGESGSDSQEEDDGEQSDVSSNDQSGNSSGEEAGPSRSKGKKGRTRREDGQESNNGDFEFVEDPNNGN